MHYAKTLRHTPITCTAINKPAQFSFQCFHLSFLTIFPGYLSHLHFKQWFYDIKRHLGVSGWAHPQSLPHKTLGNHATHHMMSHVALGLLSMTPYLSLAHLQPFSLPSFSFYCQLKLSSSQHRGTCVWAQIRTYCLPCVCKRNWQRGLEVILVCRKMSFNKHKQMPGLGI